MDAEHPVAGGHAIKNLEAINFAWTRSKSRGTARVVLGIIAGFVNRKTGESCPAQITIGELANVTDRTVRRAVEELKALGDIQVKSRASSYDTNVYRLVDYQHGQRLDGTHASADSPISTSRLNKRNNRRNNKQQARESEDNGVRSRSNVPAESEYPDWDYPDMAHEISRLFARLRTESYPEKARYEEQDARSREWLYECQKIGYDLSWDLGRIESIIRHAFDSGDYPWLSRPRQLRHLLSDIQRNVPVPRPSPDAGSSSSEGLPDLPSPEELERDRAEHERKMAEYAALAEEWRRSKPERTQERTKEAAARFQELQRRFGVDPEDAKKKREWNERENARRREQAEAERRSKTIPNPSDTPEGRAEAQGFEREIERILRGEATSGDDSK